MQRKRSIRSKTAPAQGDSRASRPVIVVMAKPAIPGLVKTRLCPPFTPDAAAAVHAAMLECVLVRLRTLAVDYGFDAVLALAGEPTRHEGWRTLDQGCGDLGERLGHVWRVLGGGPAAFFGVDSPDVPTAHLHAVADRIAAGGSGASIGPVDDGGYWTLAATGVMPALLTGIDWGSSSVYHQSHVRAAGAGIELTDLPPWHDVDDCTDVAALLQRVATSDDPAVRRMERLLTRLCEGITL